MRKERTGKRILKSQEAIHSKSVVISILDTKKIESVLNDGITFHLKFDMSFI